MYLIYNFLLIFLAIITLPFWLYKVLTKEKHRKGFWEKLGFAGGHSSISGPGAGKDRLRVHVHAVSVGEVIASTPFIKGLRQRHPEIRLTVSTVTPTGNDVARQRLPEADQILYSPFDLPWSVKRFINRVRPDIYVSVETELWPNFLREVKRSGAKSLIINGRISPDAFKGYRRFRPFMKRVLANVDLFCMQSDEDAERMREIGAPAGSVTITGNMKYDQKFIEMDEEAIGAKMRLYGIEKDDKVIVAGSTHPGEDEGIISAYLECLKDFKNPPSPPFSKGGKGGFETVSPGEKLRLIMVPRHIERSAEIEKIVKAKGLDVVRRTGLPNAEKNDLPYRTVIVVDTIGELSTLYSIATIVIIGGSFIPHGGQNPLEAMYYKKPVIFGRHMFNFKKITEEILKAGAGLMVEDDKSLKVTLSGLLTDNSRQLEMGEKGYKIIMRNKGAVERNLAIVEKFLSGC
ncbi:MAG: 3-deoxy-D-manno-octulosonic acid transferase [Nitrospirae bacterium]|nr:3-deoxy-D-manno-octulosonic acid transferase [Nitrospirota bacterium]